MSGLRAGRGREALHAVAQELRQRAFEQPTGAARLWKERRMPANLRAAVGRWFERDLADVVAHRDTRQRAVHETLVRDELHDLVTPDRAAFAIHTNGAGAF